MLISLAREFQHLRRKRPPAHMCKLQGGEGRQFEKNVKKKKKEKKNGSQEELLIGSVRKNPI